jgi:hypothetical protein
MACGQGVDVSTSGLPEMAVCAALTRLVEGLCPY